MWLGYNIIRPTIGVGLFALAFWGIAILFNWWIDK